MNCFLLISKWNSLKKVPKISFAYTSSDCAFKLFCLYLYCVLSFHLFVIIEQVLVMLKKLPEDTKKKLAKKGYIPQDGFILSYIPVPPNCLSVPDVSDGISVMSSVRYFFLFLWF